MAIWSDLIGRVKTKYVYIGRNAVHFSEYDRLERLVRQVNNLNVSVVGSAFRTLISGKVSFVHNVQCAMFLVSNY